MEKVKILVCITSQQSQKQMIIKTHQQKTKIKRGIGERQGGVGVNVDTHTHSTDWLLHILRVGGLWITVQF